MVLSGLNLQVFLLLKLNPDLYFFYHLMNCCSVTFLASCRILIGGSSRTCDYVGFCKHAAHHACRGTPPWHRDVYNNHISCISVMTICIKSRFKRSEEENKWITLMPTHLRINAFISPPSPPQMKINDSESEPWCKTQERKMEASSLTRQTLRILHTSAL